MSEERRESREAERLQRLRQKAADLPLRPGVYLMKDVGGKIIYVGKSKALRNRVSQYFEQTAAHTLKTKKMVLAVRDFDFVLCDTEIEALALENKLIKLHRPKYNIRLKDDKSYPYIRLSKSGEKQWPTLTVTRTRKNDGARYFGPYSGMADAYGIVETARRVFGLPGCKARFPEDAGKVRPCLYAQIGQCVAPCKGKIQREEYEALADEAAKFLRGSFKQVKADLEKQMYDAAEQMQFEAAALCRDRIRALERLWDKQKVVGAPDTEYDAAALYQGETCSCLAVAFVRDGVLTHSEYILFGADQIVDEEAILSALFDLYRRREESPKELELGFPVEQTETLSEILRRYGGKGRLHIPERGEKKETCRLLWENARQHTAEFEKALLRDSQSLTALARLLALETLPEQIEAVDISNLGDEQITAGLILFSNAKPNKRGYRTYKIRSTGGKQDDYASMREAIDRRLSHADTQPLPDLLLLDGGKGHVHVVRQLLEERGVNLPVYGMVKDAFHKTRTLTNGEEEIGIAGEQSVFTLIYRIQEEVHRYTVGRMMRGKRKSLTTSVLTNLPGIGEKKAAALLRDFGGLGRMRNAEEQEFAAVKGITRKDAATLRQAFLAGFPETKFPNFPEEEPT